MKSTRQIDMTQGPIFRLVVMFALPICAGNILQLLYSTVDTLVIGNYCDHVSLAAVGTSSQPVEILLCLFLGIGTGVSILVSQYAGNKDFVHVKDTVATATSFLFLTAIPLSILGLFLGPLILQAMQVPADTIDLSVAYLRIMFVGVLGNMGYNLNAGILRGMGDSRSSLLFLLISCIINIVLDFVFIAGFGMGVSGAALATIIAMYTSWIISIIYIRKHYPEVEMTLLPHRLDKKIMKEILKIGIPLGLNQSLYSVGHIVLQSLVNLQGSTFMAACSVSGKVTGIANVAITSFSSAATTFSGQNYGAKNFGRLKRGSLRIPLFSGLVTITGGLIITALCRPILGWFVKDDPAVLELAVQYVRVVLPFSWTYAVFNGIISYVNGIGEVKYPMVVNLLMLWGVRIPVAFFISNFIGGTWIMAAYPTSFIFGLTCMLCYYKTKRWKNVFAGQDLSQT